MNKFLKGLCFFLGIDTTPKEKLEEGVIGFYDCKPFDNFHYSLIYAQDTLVSDQNGIEIFTRVYKGTTFVNVLVYDEAGFNPVEFDYPHLKELLLSKNLEATEKSIVFVAFQHKNENTIAFCKKLCKSDKNNFIQGAVYNPRSVHMDFYKPIPEFYKLFDLFCEDLYIDFGFIDHVKES